MRNGENKSYRFVPFLPDAEQIMPKKKCKKTKKNSKISLWHNFKPKCFGNGQEREKIKMIVSFRSYLTGCRKFQKYMKKITKTKKYPYGFIKS